ncbi:uncharacterized protein LOC132699783 [Cylas formicarius]|uniref:uncharacterized protein LOC132699783 n=1 Tax=Cylas formicarius TaxID=197179 RepID=UPI002958B1E0|nr:uncharacterized protein LOC132699783 [Cylas formicarius]
MNTIAVISFLSLFCIVSSYPETCYYCPLSENCTSPIVRKCGSSMSEGAVGQIANITSGTGGVGVACLTVTAEGNNKDRTLKSCSYKQYNGEDICRFYQSNAKIKSCKSCDESNCNSSSSVQLSLFSFICLYVIIIVK